MFPEKYHISISKVYSLVIQVMFYYIVTLQYFFGADSIQGFYKTEKEVCKEIREASVGLRNVTCVEFVKSSRYQKEIKFTYRDKSL